MFEFINDVAGIAAEVWGALILIGVVMLLLGLCVGPGSDLSVSNLGVAFAMTGLVALAIKVKFDDWLPALAVAVFGVLCFIIGVLLSPVPEDPARSRVGWAKDLTR
jgi:membrane-bound ClpP family serine protease